MAIIEMMLLSAAIGIGIGAVVLAVDAFVYGEGEAPASPAGAQEVTSRREP